MFSTHIMSLTFLNHTISLFQTSFFTFSFHINAPFYHSITIHVSMLVFISSPHTRSCTFIHSFIFFLCTYLSLHHNSFALFLVLIIQFVHIFSLFHFSQAFLCMKTLFHFSIFQFKTTSFVTLSFLDFHFINGKFLILSRLFHLFIDAGVIE